MKAPVLKGFKFEKTKDGGYNVLMDGLNVGYVWKVRSRWSARSRMGTTDHLAEAIDEAKRLLELLQELRRTIRSAKAD